MLDLLKLRTDTPGTLQVIHLNSAGASLTATPILDVVTRHLHNEAYLGGYEAAAAAAPELEAVYVSIARLINAETREIAVIENATRAWDMVFYAIPFKPGDVILTSTTEYAGNYIPYLQLKQRYGIEIEVIPNDETGQVSLSALQTRLNRPGVVLVSLPIIATNGGPIQPVVQIGKLCREADVLFLLDACQGAGQLPLDVKEIGCHMLTATSRKYLRGPRGMGFLYVEKDLCERLEPPFLDLHSASLLTASSFKIREGARRFENWECNIAAKLGLGAATDYALDVGLDQIWQRIQSLATYLRQSISQTQGYSLQDMPAACSGIVTFTSQQHGSAQLQKRLSTEPKPINVSTSGMYSTLIDMQQRGLHEVTRASVHAYNTEEEIDKFIDALKRLAQ
ncbi:aminotransferase class V-fold PLP-dependent enzyme [Pseudomonas sp. M30-35]|uniref:aminotransferase class V-fold PLP-dependent enzyme n=1 Tax=Pseudomonas sp. M30-35 TaxID=1981174 RepID=UPI000B3CF7E6|nr:aminotransferase class V-fold PLP-dependent enzyme [Pseudomonas sp. M30-35]ARU88948.1 aminotransferase [Pseudomonas sp. M30-35]